MDGQVTMKKTKFSLLITQTNSSQCEKVVDDPVPGGCCANLGMTAVAVLLFERLIQTVSKATAHHLSPLVQV